MPNPINDLRKLPWGATLRIAAIVVIVALGIEWGMEIIAQTQAGSLTDLGLQGNSQLAVSTAWTSRIPGWLMMLIKLFRGLALGLATAELWRYQQNGNSPSNTLAWTLVGSLLIALTVLWILRKYAFAALLPAVVLTDIDEITPMGIILGSFWRSWIWRLRR